MATPLPHHHPSCSERRQRSTHAPPTLNPYTLVLCKICAGTLRLRFTKDDQAYRQVVGADVSLFLWWNVA